MYEYEVKEVKMNFNRWLNNSRISESDLIKYRAGEFKIDFFNEGQYGVINLKYIADLKEEKVGESLFYKIDDKVNKVDIALLLLYIAERLDESNRNAPAFQKREDRYFYNKVKNSIKKIPLI